jgi:hypothetical protein
MKTPRTLLFSALLLSFSLGAAAVPLSKVDYKAAKSDIENKYKADKKACNVHADNAKDICTEEAKGMERVAKAELEAIYENRLPSTVWQCIRPRPKLLWQLPKKNAMTKLAMPKRFAEKRQKRSTPATWPKPN